MEKGGVNYFLSFPQADAAGQSESWHVHISQKLLMCTDVVLDQPDTTEARIIGLFTTEPAHHLSARLQHMDKCGYVLKELLC